MAIMQGDGNWVWSLAEVALIVLSIYFIWYLTIIGRDRTPSKLKHGEEAIDRFGDGVEEDHSPLPKFLIWTYALTVIWMVTYAIWTGFHGLF